MYAGAMEIVSGLANAGLGDNPTVDVAFAGKPKKIKPETLTLRYHDFGLGSPVTVEVLKHTKKAEIIGSTTVADGGTITVRKKAGENNLGASLKLGLDGEKIGIHTSCSKPIDIGYVYADEEDAAEAESMGAFDPTGFDAALEIIDMTPPGVCGSATPSGTIIVEKLTDGTVTPGVTFTVNPNPYLGLDPALVPAGCDAASPILTVTDGDLCDRADGADGIVKLVNVPVGDYLVDEPAPPPGTAFVGCDPNPVTVQAGGSGSTTCTNKELGDLTIEKLTDGTVTPGVTFTVNPNPYLGLDPALVPAGCDAASHILVVTDGDL
jgi:hypothetical protein